MWARQCNYAKKSFSHTSAPTANSTTTNNSSPNWLLDTRASHHVTSNLNNLSLSQPYKGPDDIVIGDGTSLHITHVGHSTLSTPSNSFTLSNVLCVPSMKQNLVSVSQFCKNNNISIEFFPSFFCVKDLSTGAHLARG